MRRAGPRPIATGLRRAAGEVAPLAPLARIQEAWPAVAGERVAREAEPVAERDGLLTVACTSAVWAQELDLLSADLVERLNGALGAPEEQPPVRRVRLVTRSRRLAP